MTSTQTSTTTQTYDTASGEIATSTDALNRTASMGSDRMGRVTSHLAAETYTENWCCNRSGLLKIHSDKMGVRDQPGYDAYGRGLIISRSQAVGTAVARTIATNSDADGKVAGTRHALANWTTKGLDCVGRVRTFTADLTPADVNAR